MLNHNCKAQDHLKGKLLTVSHLHHKDNSIEKTIIIKVKFYISWLINEFLHQLSTSNISKLPKIFI